MAAPRSIALIVNARSGSGREPGDLAEGLAALGPSVEVFEPGDAEAAAGSGAERVVVAGGDGSIAPAAAAAGAADLPLAVIPVGTANDFARGLELPSDLLDALHLAARGTVLRRLDLCLLGERPFVNAASAGLAAQAAERATGLKRVLGPLAYMVGALGAGLSERPIRCAVRLDGHPVFEGRAWQLTVAGTGSFGAGSRLESAVVDDGLLDVAVMQAGTRLRLVAYAYGLRSGTLTRRRGVRHGQAAEAELELPSDTELNVDGELVRSGPVGVSVQRGAFRLVVG